MPGTVRFKARLSSALPWTVEAYDSAGTVVASWAGFGPNVDWTWDATLLPPGSYTYAIRSEDSVTPALGPIGGAGVEAALSVAGLVADPETVSPNDDDIADATTLTYTLSAPANVTVKVHDSFGAEAATIANKAWKRAGEHAIRFDPAVLPDGVFKIELLATATGGRQATATTQLAVSRTLGEVRAARVGSRPTRTVAPIGSPSASSSRPRRGAAADPQAGKWVATPFKGLLEPGVRKVEWDGAKRVGSCSTAPMTRWWRRLMRSRRRLCSG